MIRLKNNTKSNKYGFTLVELIVVITILAILGTIAFISLQGYSKDARDSTRISDLSSMKTSLEVFQLDNGKYPVPTDGTDILYSGAIVWTQGIFGETVYANVSNLDKIPTDPITNGYYTYSTTQNRGEYQLGGMIEGDTIALNSEQGIVNNVLAAGTVEAKAIITGNYNGQVVKSLSGSTLCNIIAVPSIITNDTTVIDLNTINTENRFVYRGQKNLPSTFKSSKFNNEGGFAFSVNDLIAYTDNQSCSKLTSKIDYSKRVLLLKGIQNAYSGTILKDEGEIKNIINLNIDTSNPSTEVRNYAGLFVNNNLGGNVGLDLGSNGGPITGLVLDNSGYMYDNGTYGTSCKEYLDSGVYNSEGDGVYWIKPNSSSAFQAYCDMTTDGGGWTRFIRVSGDYPLTNAENCYNGSVVTSGNMDCFNPNRYDMTISDKMMLKMSGSTYYFTPTVKTPSTTTQTTVSTYTCTGGNDYMVLADNGTTYYYLGLNYCLYGVELGGVYAGGYIGGSSSSTFGPSGNALWLAHSVYYQIFIR